MTLNDFKPPKQGFLVNFLRFPAATHILRVKCAEMAWDGLGQPVYDIYSIKRTFFKNISFDLLNPRSLPYGGFKFKYSFKMN